MSWLPSHSSFKERAWKVKKRGRKDFPLLYLLKFKGRADSQRVTLTCAIIVPLIWHWFTAKSRAIESSICFIRSVIGSVAKVRGWTDTPPTQTAATKLQILCETRKHLWNYLLLGEFSRVQEYIHSHICEEIDIDELSEVACISQAARAVLKFILFS